MRNVLEFEMTNKFDVDLRLELFKSEVLMIIVNNDPDEEKRTFLEMAPLLE
jgi:hypothetical protein